MPGGRFLKGPGLRITVGPLYVLKLCWEEDPHARYTMTTESTLCKEVSPTRRNLRLHTAYAGYKEDGFILGLPFNMNTLTP